MSFNADLGFQLESDGTVRLDPQPRHEVAPGTIHFAVLTTLGEVAAAQAADGPVVPAQLSVQLLRRARTGAPLLARGRKIKAGRTLLFAAGEVEQNGHTVAVVSVTFARVD